jgi:hypothetical protein
MTRVTLSLRFPLPVNVTPIVLVRRNEGANSREIIYELCRVGGRSSQATVAMV